MRKAALAADAGAIYTPAALNKDQTKRAAEGVVEPGEVVELATRALVGSPQLGRQVAIGVATAIATAGLLSMAVSEIRSEFPRSALRGRAHRVVTHHALDVTDAEGRLVGRMRFPFWNRADAKAIVDALGPPPPTAKK